MSDQEVQNEAATQSQPQQNQKRLIHLSSLVNHVIGQSKDDPGDLVEFSVHGKLLSYTRKSLNLFDAENKIRLWAIWMIEWIWFDRFIITVIFLNSILLATQDYSWRETDSEAPNSWTDSFEYIFTAIFIIEFLLKMIAMGFLLDKQTYLRDGWNFIDFIVVITGIISLFISARVSAIRIIRIMRPLRSINSLKQMKVLIITLLDSLPALGNVVIFLLFIIILFGILGLQIFMGALENRCRMTEHPVGNEWVASNYTKLCQDSSNCPDGTYCGNPNTYNLPQQESDDETFNYGYTNFNNIISATFTIFQALTTEGWTKLIFIYQEALSTAIVYIYFLLLIFLGSFFVVNLILAVINDSFMAAQMRSSIKNSQASASSQQQEDNEEEELEQNAEEGEGEQQQDPIALTGNIVNGNQTQNQQQEHEQQINEEIPQNLNELNQIKIPDNQNNGEQQLQQQISKSNTLEQIQQSRRQSKKRSFKLKQSKFRQFQLILIVIIENKYFLAFITSIIILNTITLSLDRYPITKTESDILDIANQVFTVIFTIEMTLKLIAFDTNYLKDSMNIFDAVIVILSLIEWILSSFSAIQAFRTLRLFRLFKLARTWSSFRKLLSAIAATVGGIAYFIILLLLFMSVAALLGMELFAYKTPYRYNFNNYLSSMLVVFMLLTNESWNTIAYTFMYDLESIYPVIYFVVVIIFGNFILLKLFIAILINNFHEANVEQSQSIEENNNLQSSRHDQSMAENHQSIKVNQVSPEQVQQSFQVIKSASNQQTNNNSATRFKNISSQFMASAIVFNSTINQSQLEGVSLFIFPPQNKIRIRVSKLINHKYFEFFILTIIIISSILLALDDPLSSSNNITLNVIDEIITALFICEAALKIISKGFILNGPDSYIRSPGNILDLVVIIFSSLAFDESQAQTFSKIKILRVIRVLRPLRLIVRNEDLKMSINALFNSLSQMMNIALVCLIFFLLFGIFGVTQFKGAYYHCDVEDVNDKLECFDKGGSWSNKNFNFDNVLNAMITLFVISTTEGWINLMSDGIDSRGIDLNPQENNAYAWALYFVFFIIVGSFFIINLFAGVIVEAFQSEKDRLSQMRDLSKQELEWYEIQQKIYSSVPIEKFKISKHKTVRQLNDIISSDKFEIFILSVIILNTCVMMIQYLRSPQELTDAIQILNWIFLAIFSIEAILKLIVYRKFYFTSGWNVFDFTVVLLTILGVILEQSNVLSNVGTATSILRTFRIFRVLRLIKSAKNLRIIFGTFLVTLPGLVSVGGLLGIMLFIFAVVFMNLFPYVKRGEGVTGNSNFSSFGVSLFTLFKCSTGEDWNLVMMDTARTAQPNDICFDFNDYANYAEYGFMGCGNVGGILLMIIFMIIVSLIMLNLFVAIIIEGFQNTSKEENAPIKKLDVENFQQQWKDYDKNATGFMQCKYFTQFMIALPQPLGWSKLKYSAAQQRIRMAQLNLPVYNLNGKNMYFYHQALICAAQDFLESSGFISNFEISKDIIKMKLQPLIEKAFSPVSNLETEFDSGQYMAAVLIQQNAKRSLQKLKKSKSSVVVAQYTNDDEVQQFVA
ncbi:unnamed protein product (macronuclear) [Paramecium tetraurelia]|uniref:EF-hand domain-containing protein n=1 Tax=Paramecium tetraurelia TaxID=5888 RepID=A0BV23_PARTE|nr:uncharacterized protein GSPATT00005636001 [Paramecium tetraurelia]CAK62390.1 unnamed protein product [Paramecium tetraurelia]|eukprot:XP_001429788.1 hypothetical protein (macronuclear) [Paramecium tetraurelia strain d4-2]